MKRRRLGADRLIALAWAPNSAAMPADTSSAAGANAPVVGTAAAAFAALMVERMAAKSVAAASNASGLAITNDIAHLPPARDNPAAPGTVDAYGRNIVLRSPTLSRGVRQIRRSSALRRRQHWRWLVVNASGRR